MKASDYRTLLGLLASANLLLARNVGDLNAADIRIRCLINITEKEAQRALLEIFASERLIAKADHKHCAASSAAEDHSAAFSAR